MSSRFSKLSTLFLTSLTLILGVSSVGAMVDANVQPTPNPVVASALPVVVSPSSSAVVVSSSPVSPPQATSKPAPEPQAKAVVPAPSSEVSLPSATPTPLQVEPTQAPTPSAIVLYRIETDSAILVGEIDAAGQTVAEVTGALAAKHGVSFVYETSDLGWFVTEIAGVKQDPRNGYYWLYYVNGQLASKGADQVRLQAGDSLVWRYTKT